MKLQTCPDPQQLQRLVEGSLDEQTESALEEHLSACESCRSKVDQSIQSADWWQQARGSLRALLCEPEADDSPHPPIDVLPLLGPTNDPEKLGRIAEYEVIGIIGRGGMGVVFKAFDPRLSRFVAIKMLLPHLAASGAARKRFAREGQAAAAVVDDYVLPIYAVSEWKGVPYLVTQYSRGTTLQRRVQSDGPLEVKEILRLGMQTARGLAAAHAQGLVHRDVKPSNILLDGSVERAMLTDFGLARAVDDASITRTGIIAGTPQFMSPEQARGGSVDARSDLFSLGCVIYFLCTGHPPFRADNSYAILRLITDEEPRAIREINADIPTWLCSIVQKLMSKKAEDRYASANEVAELLEACLAHVSSPLKNSLPVVVSRPSWRIRWNAIMSDKRILSLVAFGLFIAGFLLPWPIAAMGRDEHAMIFAGVSILLAVSFAVMSRRESFSRIVLVTIGGVFGLLLIGVLLSVPIYFWRGRAAAEVPGSGSVASDDSTVERVFARKTNISRLNVVKGSENEPSLQIEWAVDDGISWLFSESPLRREKLGSYPNCFNLSPNSTSYVPMINKQDLRIESTFSMECEDADDRFWDHIRGKKIEIPVSHENFAFVANGGTIHLVLYLPAASGQFSDSIDTVMSRYPEEDILKTAKELGQPVISVLLKPFGTRLGTNSAGSNSSSDSKPPPKISSQSTLAEAVKTFNEQSASDRRTLFNPPIPDMTEVQLREGLFAAQKSYRDSGESQLAEVLEKIGVTGRIPEESLTGVFAGGVARLGTEAGRVETKQIAPALILPDGLGGHRHVVLRSLELIYNRNGDSSRHYGDVHTDGRHVSKINVPIILLLSGAKHSKATMEQNLKNGKLSLNATGVMGRVEGADADGPRPIIFAHDCTLDAFEEVERGGDKFWRATFLAPLQRSFLDLQPGMTLEEAEARFDAKAFQVRLDKMWDDGARFELDHYLGQEPQDLADSGKTTAGIPKTVDLSALQGNWKLLMTGGGEHHTDAVAVIDGNRVSVNPKDDGTAEMRFVLHLDSQGTPQPVDLEYVFGATELLHLQETANHNDEANSTVLDAYPLRDGKPCALGIIERTEKGFRICMEHLRVVGRPVAFEIGETSGIWELVPPAESR